MVTGPFALACNGDLVGKSREHAYLLAHRCQWPQDRRQLEGTALSHRRPLTHLDPVRHVNGTKAAHRSRCRVTHRHECRNHAIKQW